MALRIPTSQLDRPEGTKGDRKEFPAGLWFFEIGDARQKDTPEFFHQGENPQVKGDTGTQVGVQLDAAQAAEDGQQDPGNQKHFLDFIIYDGDHSILDVDPSAKEAAYGWGIQRDARMLARLARALGQTVEVDGAVEVAEDFVKSLLGGRFKGQRVLVRIEHETFTKRDKTAGSKAVTREILPA